MRETCERGAIKKKKTVHIIHAFTDHFSERFANFLLAKKYVKNKIWLLQAGPACVTGLSFTFFYQDQQLS